MTALERMAHDARALAADLDATAYPNTHHDVAVLGARLAVVARALGRLAEYLHEREAPR